MKTKLLLFAMTIAFILSACKGDDGPQGPQGAQGTQGPSGPESKYYDFSLTFGPSTTYGSYSLAGTIFDGDDMVATYWKEPGTGWLIQLPYVFDPSASSVGVNIWPEVASATLFINTTRVDDVTSSSWISSITLDFRAVVIKTHSLIEHPDVNFSNYKEVERVFNLQD